MHKNTANWIRFSFPTERLFALNAFSMGAWATGTNTGIALAKVCMVKSTGPDVEKIIDTIERFGTEYDYLVTAYPPFLKHVVDALDERDFDWSATRVYGIVGGEGMTEAMRDYLEQRLVKVRSGYGASDVQFGIAGENDLSVWVRKLLVARADVRESLLGPGEERVPMVFQYNPLDNYIEINDDGEAVITATNLSILSPKLRYNVGDEAFTMGRGELVRRLVSLGVIDSKRAPLPLGWASPFLFLFGRRDSTISYMGANIYPIDVEYGLYRDRNVGRPDRGLLPRASRGERSRVEAGGARAAAIHGRVRRGGARACRCATRLGPGRPPPLGQPRLRRGGARGPVRGRGARPAARPRNRPVRRRQLEDQECLRAQRERRMKTNDLSKFPRYGQANAVFIGASEYTGLRALLALWPNWLRLRRRLKAAPGFCGHYVYYKFPLTFGQVVLFENMDQMLRFARNKSHRELMSWVTEHDGEKGRNANAGFIRMYEALPDGSYANGAWSAEGAAGYDERFTATSKETEGPPVRPQKAKPPE